MDDMTHLERSPIMVTIDVVRLDELRKMLIQRRLATPIDGEVELHDLSAAIYEIETQTWAPLVAHEAKVDAYRASLPNLSPELAS